MTDGAWLYILRCSDGSYYVGTARGSLESRIAQHNAGAFQGCTASRRPVELIFSQWSDRITDAIALSAIPEAADRGAPRHFAGKADNPISQILQNADIGWTASRGPITATGAQDVLSLATPLTGTLNVTGSLTSKATGAIGDALGGLLGNNVAKQIGGVNIKALNANAEIKGNVTITARPKLAVSWHIEPNLAAQVDLGDTSLSLAGARVNVPSQVKPLIDKTVADQITALAERIRNDPSLERNARAQWAKACRSIPLQGTGAASSLPAL